jgi:hypothetical protein
MGEEDQRLGNLFVEIRRNFSGIRDDTLSLSRPQQQY